MNPILYHCQYPPCQYKSKRSSNCKQHMEKAHGWSYDSAKQEGKFDLENPPLMPPVAATPNEAEESSTQNSDMEARMPQADLSPGYRYEYDIEQSFYEVDYNAAGPFHLGSEGVNAASGWRGVMPPDYDYPTAQQGFGGPHSPPSHGGSFIHGLGAQSQQLFRSPPRTPQPGGPSSDTLDKGKSTAAVDSTVMLTLRSFCKGQKTGRIFHVWKGMRSRRASPCRASR